MKTFTESIIERSELKIFNDIKRVLDSINTFELPADHLVSCHELCSAMGRVWSLRMETGYYLPGFEHSWLMTGSADKPPPYDSLIDVYPVGMIGGPILISNELVIYMRRCEMYKIKKLPNVDFKSDSFLQVVNVIENELRARLFALGPR